VKNRPGCPNDEDRVPGFIMQSPPVIVEFLYNAVSSGHDVRDVV
jgi:hypothetical protein